MNFWDQLLKQGPVVGLSPMDGVTDAPMRYMTAKYGKPDVLFTEFVSVDALRHAKEPAAVERLMKTFIRARDVGSLEIKPYEIAQVFGHGPELFYQAAVIVASLGFDGMDINMGCPAHKVEEHGSGAGLIRTPEIAQEIVRQAKRGVRDYREGKVTVSDLEVGVAVKEWVGKHAHFRTPEYRDPVDRMNGNRESGTREHEIPVSVKTRIGVDQIVAEEWMEALMEVQPAMISLHGRTLKQLYQGQADWEAIGRAAEVVHHLGGHILGNGDVQSVTEGMRKVKEYGVDGFLIGRAAEGNPAIFAGITEPSWEERKKWMIEHAEIYDRVYGAGNFMPMRKHLAWYCKGFSGASELREKLVRIESSIELESRINSNV